MSARTRKSLVLFWTALFVFSIVLQYANFIVAPAPALAVHADGTFELDGNATDDATAGADWSVLDDGSADPNNDDTADASVFIVDAVPERSFTGGGSKDDLNTSAWAHTTQNVPDKDDIQHAFAALYGDTIYFGADRYSNDGDAQVGFWFFKNGISINADGTFTPVHTVGDLLVVSHFTNGGAVSTIELYQWVGTGGDTNGTLDLLATGQTCTGAPATDVACAIANAGNTASPWPYDPKQGADNVFGANAFFEGGLDLSDVFGGQIPCFTGFLVETRASQSVDATLQDFASGAFDTCASITIIKDAVPNDAQDFAFTTTGTGLSNFSLDDDADATLSNTKVFTGLNPGSYTVDEGAVAGWDLTGLVCNDANGTTDLATGVATINLTANEDVTCTYTNTKRGTIIVEKQTSPDGVLDTFTFTGTAAGTIGDGGQIVVNNLVPGQYTSTENDPTPPFDLGSIVCSDANSSGNVGTRTATFNLDPGETVTCVFTNVQRGTITIIKNAIPDGPQDFAYTTTGGLGAFSLDDDANATLSNTQVFANVMPGAYSVTETALAGWDLTGLECNGTAGSTGTPAGATANINLTAGGSVTCTYTNTQRGHIIVDKVTNPAGDAQSFSFDAGGGTYADFSLTDQAAPNDQELVPGTYSVAETVPTGWDLTSATCSDGSPVNAISLQAGETVTCTFTNTKRGTIIVDKVTVPAGDSQLFIFDSSWTADFQLADATAPHNSGGLVPGTYSVAETVPDGWDLTSAVCSDGSLISSINLAAGETVTCTFTNTQRGHIIVDKVTNPAGDAQSFSFDAGGGTYADFSLTDQAAPNDQELVPGTYSVAETVPTGWDLTSATCSDGSPVNAISLQAGETVTCTFTNTKRGTIIVEKQTSPDGAAGSFTFTGTAAGAIGDGGQIVVNNLVPGQYTSTEADPAPNFDLGAITCSDANSSGTVGTRTATFNLDPGETVTCVFTNVQRGTITIIKNAVPDDAQDFSFSTTGAGLSGFSLDDDANATLSNTKTFANVPEGSYSVTEAAVAGWDLTNLVCTPLGGSSATPSGATANITMVPGGSVVCTYTNSKPAIQVVKTAGTAADGAEFVTPPGNVTYTYMVTNTGPVALSNVKVRDDNGTPANTADDFDATCPKTTLAAGESMTCTATVAVPATANRTNVATATGTSAGGTNVSDTDNAVVRAPLLTITKGVTGNTGGSAPNGDPEAKVGDTLTYTLTYDLSFGPVTNGVITDKLPAGVTYVTGSATGNAQFTFDSYNATTRTLTWKAATVSVDGSVTYKVTVDAGANELAQPLVNTAAIDSDQTDKDDDTQNVFVEAPPQAATATPVRTLPPTDTFDTGGSQGNPGFSLMLVLLAIGGFVLAVGFITPVPERVRRRDRRG